MSLLRSFILCSKVSASRFRDVNAKGIQLDWFLNIDVSTLTYNREL